MCPILILYAKDGRIPPSVIEMLVERVRSPRSVSSTGVAPADMNGAEEAANDNTHNEDPPANDHAVTVSHRRPRRPPPTPVAVDPFDASGSVPKRLGGAHMPPVTNLLALIEARPESEKAWAAADILSHVRVGPGFVSAFEVVRQILVPDVRDAPSSSPDYIAFLTKVQQNPSAFQASVVARCTQTDNMTDKKYWLSGNQYHNIPAFVCIRGHETMEIRRWPATCVSQQENYALCRTMRDAVHMWYSSMLNITQVPR